jgi:VWFA-related protein
MRLTEKQTSGKPTGEKKILASLLVALILLPSVSAPQTPEPASDTVIKVTSELVLTNVTVRDKNGKSVRGLKPEDFTVLEDSKPQQVVSFDFEDVDTAQLPATEQAQDQGPQQAVVLGARQQPGTAQTPTPDTASLLTHHRLVVLFFDLSSMQPDEIGRGVTAAEKYVDQQMSSADLVAVVSLANDFQVNLDFTADRAQLRRVLQSMDPGSGQGFENGSTGDTEGTPDTAQAFTPDETEYNIFNADRRLEALRSLASLLSHIEQKKSVIYISSGMTRTGIENQSELRAAVNDAVRANLSIYTMDVRGLQAIIPGGDASQASLRGTSAYSGAAMRNSMDANFSSQDTLVTLASDTGGRAFLDTNDLGSVFRGVQQDTATYYVLGYRSTNPARDGRFRRVAVRVKVPDVKLDYRAGYYAPRDFEHSNKDDRERLLDEELASDIPSTDLRVYLSTAYFRLRDDKVYSAVSLLVPGSQIPFLRSKEQDKASLDISGIVQDELKRPAGRVRDTVQLAVPESQEVARKNVQYNTAFVLAPGKYHLKFVMRENQSGKLGSFQTDLEVPDFKNTPVKASSILLAGQRQPAAKRQADNPLTRDGLELIPSVTHVFSQKQHLYLYYEVYDPGRSDSAVAGDGEKNGSTEPGIRILSNVLFFNGKVKAYETPLVESRALNIPNRHAAVFQLDIPLAGLRPGFYTCQVNLIDDASGRFVFRRLPIKLLQ